MKCGLDTCVADRLIPVKGAHIGGDEGLDAVAEAAGYLPQGYAGAEPRRRCRVAAVVDAEGRMVDRPERSMPRPAPRRFAWSGAGPSAEQQLFGNG